MARASKGDNYGAWETNPPSERDNWVSTNIDHMPPVQWDAPGVVSTRLRLISDPGCPWGDVGYCHGLLNGKPARILLPFNQLPKRGCKGALFKHAKASGCYIAGLSKSLSFCC